jgi:hypothetical protein
VVCSSWAVGINFPPGGEEGRGYGIPIVEVQGNVQVREIRKARLLSCTSYSCSRSNQEAVRGIVCVIVQEKNGTMGMTDDEVDFELLNLRPTAGCGYLLLSYPTSSSTLYKIAVAIVIR